MHVDWPGTKGLICGHIGTTMRTQEPIYGDCHEYR